MKVAEKDSEKVFWDQMRSPPTTAIVGQTGSQSRMLSKLLLWLICFVSFTYVVYTLKLVSSSHGCSDEPFYAIHRHRHSSSSSSSSSSPSSSSSSSSSSSPSSSSSSSSPSSSSSSSSAIPINNRNATRILSSSLPIRHASQETQDATELRHLVFGIAASANLWQQRKNYIKLWFNPPKMKGIVWLDKPVKTQKDEKLPPVKISGDTSRFAYSNRQGHRSAIRISRIVSETLRLNLSDVRWFVMGDDDTVFITDNLIRILRKYDHNQFYYIGSSSESHLQNIYFSYAMAYGGGGFAISYPLAKALDKMQEKCIQRYPGLYGSDDRMQACMAELGVPLTRELGFHQYDVYGNLFGLLAAHPVTPFVSLHHLDVVEPIFPNVTRVEALKRLNVPMQLDSAALMQQSICYDRSRTWTISVSWGFAVQIFKGVLSPREVEMPSRTFLNWYRRADYTAYAFNTRPVSRNPCQKAIVFYLSKARFDSNSNRTKSTYERHRVPSPTCKWKMPDPSQLDIVEVLKAPDPNLWVRSPRRNCCRITESKKANTMVIDVGVCEEGEISEI